MVTEVTPGVVGFLQTSGELLNFHPHVHILMPPMAASAPMEPSAHWSGFNCHHLERLFQAELLRMLYGQGPYRRGDGS